ncbi:hypothetical protein CFC21_086158 [Triticum aestivum]|uniref:Uncharacterized protein n=2 Tax=Triticum aestivum TaxID=4565 RepID=A0A9R1IEM3_WHEAT|nr:hypothetical protein CFC21_086157 [Triticum aestivum]KAF7082284.1 hypothetical protein CFC21_086158 [Triticum aestivum]
MPPPSSPKTRSSSVPKWTKHWSPSSPGSPASVSRVLRSPASSRSPTAASALDPSSPRCTTTCPSSAPATTSSGRSSARPTFSRRTLTRLSKPNVMFLHECGLGACDIAKLCIRVPRMLTTNPERVRTMVACAEGLGVPRSSGMFRKALHAVACISDEKITAKVDYLKKTLRWSDAEASIAVRKHPGVLRKSKESLKSRSKFLLYEVGLEPVYIAHRPTFLSLSLEGRLRPWHYVVKFLKENGFVDRDLSFYSVVMRPEKYFMEKYICPHKKAAPHLAEDYATACKGEVPANFKFT